MSQEKGTKYISKKDWQAINTHPPYPPVSYIQSIPEIGSPADALRTRSILSEFDLADGEKDLLRKGSKAMELGHHYLLDVRREAYHRLHDLRFSSSQEDKKTLQTYHERIKHINSELGIGSPVLLLEDHEVPLARNVAAVLKQFEETHEDWPEEQGLTSGIIHKFNRERTRNNKQRR